MPINLNSLNNFQVVNNHVQLTANYLKTQKWCFKKITGTRFAAIFGLNKYNSPFKTWMTMVNLYKDVMDPTLAKAGNVIEPKIRTYISKLLNIDFKIYDPKEIGWDAFKENKIFGGIPDGEPLNKLKIVDYSTDMPMLEIKTSSIDSFVYKRVNNQLKMTKDVNGLPVIKEKNAKKNTWFNENGIEISKEYQMQLALYLYLRNTTKGIFAIGFLEGKDYAAPEEFEASNHDIQVANFEIDRNLLDKYIQFATKWYHQHIDTGISPEMTEDDHAWLKSELEILGK